VQMNRLLMPGPLAATECNRRAVRPILHLLEKEPSEPTPNQGQAGFDKPRKT
jgi:hypothetical protein